jgi:hypothetical protein
MHTFSSRSCSTTPFENLAGIFFSSPRRPQIYARALVRAIRPPVFVAPASRRLFLLLLYVVILLALSSTKGTQFILSVVEGPRFVRMAVRDLLFP